MPFCYTFSTPFLTRPSCPLDSQGKLNGHEQLRQVLEPLKSLEEATADWGEDETIIELPVHRLGVGLTAYWLPLRSDISMAQLPTLLANCGVPKQALLVPLEVCYGAKVSLPSVGAIILSEVYFEMILVGKNVFKRKGVRSRN